MTTTASTPPLVEIRCTCNKLLAKVWSVNVYAVKIQIACPRCGILYDNIK